MNFEACFRLLADRLKDEVIVTSAGNCSELWWEITGETERVFYLEASMSLASLFAAGIALGAPERTVVAFSGDGAFCMNPGMLLVERQLALPNLKHFMVANGCYGSTNDLAHPFGDFVDYAAMAKAAGIERVYEFSTAGGSRAGAGRYGARSRPCLCGFACRAARPARSLAAARRPGSEISLRPLFGANRRTAGIRYACASAAIVGKVRARPVQPRYFTCARSPVNGTH